MRTAAWSRTAEVVLLLAAWLLTRGLRDAPVNAINDARATAGAPADAGSGRGHTGPWRGIMREWGWLVVAEWSVALAARAQGKLAGKPPSVINSARAASGWALCWMARYCVRQSERAAYRSGGSKERGGEGWRGGSEDVRGAERDGNARERLQAVDQDTGPATTAPSHPTATPHSNAAARTTTDTGDEAAREQAGRAVGRRVDG